jgi:hypothetical protein
VPVIAPSYVYSFFALVAISSILIAAFSSYTSTLRRIPEVEQLQNLLNHVASKGYELIALGTATNSTSRAVLQLPPAIGSRSYWIRFRTEPARAWVEGSVGPAHLSAVAERVFFPKQVYAQGNYSCGYGPALLDCFMNGSTINLRLRTWSESL